MQAGGQDGAERCSVHGGGYWRSNGYDVLEQRKESVERLKETARDGREEGKAREIMSCVEWRQRKAR